MLALSVTLLASSMLASAMPAPQDVQGAPACAASCMRVKLSEVSSLAPDCDDNDLGCYCGTSTFTGAYSNCVNDNCPAGDVDRAQNLVSEFCANVGSDDDSVAGRATSIYSSLVGGAAGSMSSEASDASASITSATSSAASAASDMSESASSAASSAASDASSAADGAASSASSAADDAESSASDEASSAESDASSAASSATDDDNNNNEDDDSSAAAHGVSAMLVSAVLLGANMLV